MISFKRKCYTVFQSSCTILQPHQQRELFHILVAVWCGQLFFKFNHSDIHIVVSQWGFKFSSVSQFSCSVVSDSLWPHEPQHARPLCPSPMTRVYSNSYPLNRWCHPAISPSVVPFSSYLQSLPASGSFPKSQLFTWGGQSTVVSTSASVLPMNIQDWSPLGWTGWIFWQSKGLSRVFSNTTVQKHQFFSAQFYRTTGKTIALTRQTSVGSHAF